MVKKMKISVGLLLLAVAAASPEARYFRYERPVQKSTGQSCVVLDARLFAHVAPQLADLRLYRDGAETPFVIRTDAAAEIEGKALAPLNLGSRNGQTVFDASMPDDRYSDIRLTVNGQNFIATVTVTGSQTESGGAETKIGSYTIFDLTGQKLGRSTVLHLPESDFRYLHFSIKGPLSPESITGLMIKSLPMRQPKYDTVAESSQVTQKGRSSVLEITVPAHVPVDRIAFTPDATPALFSRDVNIMAVSVTPSTTAEVNSQQSLTSSGNILRVHRLQNGQRIDEERLALDVPREDFSTPAKWTISIENGDDAPLQMKTVQLQMLERNLCFEAEGNGSYALYYGDAALEAPSYDYAKLFALQANAARITAGPEELNSTYQQRPDTRPFTEKHPALLWVALAAVIALLGGIALRSAKPAAQPPK
jgi:hypothetical protein